MTGHGTSASVRFLGVPVQLYLALQQHNDAMLRELAFLSADGNTTQAAELARRLRAIVRAEHTEVAESRARMRDQVFAALEREETFVDLEDIPEPYTAEASMQYVDLLDEVDALCREGKLVLVASSPDVKRLRRWFATEMRNQALYGGAPTAFDAAATRIGE